MTCRPTIRGGRSVASSERGHPVNVVVLGAGVVGVASAWYLREAGHDVRVLDRHATAGMETSFANGG